MSKNDRVVVDNTERIEPVVPMFRGDVMSVFGIGAAVGVITWVAMTLLERYVFAAVMCQGEGSGNCENAASYALIVALVLGALAGLIALVQTRIYRPLLVILAATAALWGFSASLLQGVEWFWALPVSGLLFALAYTLFAWIARLRSFILSAVISVVLVVIIRLIMNS